jgi:hypothetical protein
MLGILPRRVVVVSAAFALMLLLNAAAYAQSSSGSVRGTVRDQSSAVIPKAKLVLVNNATNVALQTVSNEAGLYVFPSVIPGEYTLTVEFAGMQTLRAAVRVQVQQSTVFDPVLQAGSTETRITVTGEAAPLLVVDSPTLGHVLERQRIEQLPINGRRIESLLVTVPGLENLTSNESTVQVRSWGMMAGAHDFFLDGAALSEPMWNEGTITRPPGLDTIQEFKVENNASSAKFSRMTNIIMSTKSGTNSFHGTAFETNRNNAYGKARSRTDFGAFPELSRNEYGGTLGGPVILPKLYNGKNRTFFFTSVELYRNINPTSMSGYVPTTAMANGDFSGLKDSQGRLYTIYDPWSTDTNTWSRQPFSYGGKLNQIDPSRLSPLGKYFFSVMPTPTFPDRNPLLEPNWFGPGENNTNQWTITERFDHRFSDKDTFYARYSQGGQDRLYISQCLPTNDKVGCYYNVDNANRSLATSWVRTISPTLINEVVFSASYDWRSSLTGEPGVSYTDQLGLPNPFKSKGFPYFSNVGFGATNYLRPVNQNERHYTFYIVDENVTKIVGKHELQFGAHLRYDVLNTLPQLMFNTGQVDYNNSSTALYDPASSRTSPLGTTRTGHNIANVYLGLAGYSTPLRKGLFRLRRHEDAFYFQDNIKATPRLTLNLGIRWQLSPFISDKDGVTISGFDPASRSIVLSQSLDYLYEKGITLPVAIQRYQQIGVKFATYDQVGLPQKLAYNNWKDFGPHVGLAYRVGDGRKSFVIRSGFSTSYFNDGIWTWMDQSAANTPYTASFNNFMLTDSAQSPDGIAAYGMRSVPTIIAGKNSRDAVSLSNPQGINPGTTYNYYFNPDQPTDYVHDWNFTIEKQIMADTIVRTGYVGNHGGNQIQGYFYNDNMPAYIWYETKREPTPTGALANVARRNFDQTVYGSIVEYRKSGWSNYNGVQFQLERQYSKGIAFQLSYVVGNAFRAGGTDSGGGYTSPVQAVNQFMPGTVPEDYDARNRFLTYARDISVPKHRMRYNFLVDLPFGRGKKFGSNATGVVEKLIGGWQLAGLGDFRSNYGSLTTSYWNFTGAALEFYGYDYPIQDCRSGTCYPGYLMYNGYIPSNKINSTDANGKPNGVMGVPANYKPAMTPLIPWGSTTMPANAPANTNLSTYWDTNTVWIKLNNGTIQRTTYDTGLHPWRNQYFPTSRWRNFDASLFKRIRIREGVELRFTVDAFNVFNHPNNSTSVSAAGILSTQGQTNKPREMQLSVRLSW